MNSRLAAHGMAVAASWKCEIGATNAITCGFASYLPLNPRGGDSVSSLISIIIFTSVWTFMTTVRACTISPGDKSRTCERDDRRLGEAWLPDKRGYGEGLYIERQGTRDALSPQLISE